MNRPMSWFEATARERIAGFVDAHSFQEFLPPQTATPSQHIAQLGLVGSFDDGVVIGQAQLAHHTLLLAAQEGQFMGGSVGETHGAKLVGLLKKALLLKPAAVVLMIDSGGVRLHEANAGLIAISEIMRALLDVRAAGIPVIALVGGRCGAFGGMGVVASLCSSLIMSEEGRLALSGPEVIETVAGVEEFDSKDRALVWRVTGGKHRFLMGDASDLVEDDIAAFRAACIAAMSNKPESTLEKLLGEQARLSERLTLFGSCVDAFDIWAQLGIPHPEQIAMLSAMEVKEL